MILFQVMFHGLSFGLSFTQREFIGAENRMEVNDWAEEEIKKIHGCMSFEIEDMQAVYILKNKNLTDVRYLVEVKERK